MTRLKQAWLALPQYLRDLLTMYFVSLAIVGALAGGGWLVVTAVSFVWSVSKIAAIAVMWFLLCALTATMPMNGPPPR